MNIKMRSEYFCCVPILRQSKGIYIEFVLSENRHSTSEVQNYSFPSLFFFFIIIIRAEEKIRILRIAISFTWNIHSGD